MCLDIDILKVRTEQMQDVQDNGPVFTVIMPTYNRVQCIRESIDSLMRQTCAHFELIVVDDGSEDGTCEFVKTEYQSEMTAGRLRLAVIPHGGVCKARNAGLRLAKGEWIAYLDSDNRVEPDFLESFAKAISEYTQADAFYCKLWYMNSGRVIGRTFDFEALRLHNYIDLGAYVHRRTLVALEGGFDEAMTRLVDWELVVRYSRRHPPIFVDKALLAYNDSKGGNRITNSGCLSYYVNLNHVRRRHCADYPIVTTVITAYRHEKFISKAIESAVAQEGRFIHEILISDDASPDGTRAIVRKYAKTCPGLIRDISGEQNVGISGNMRKCFSAAAGKYVAVLEGDDFWRGPTKLARQVDFLETNPECPMVFCALEIMNSSGKIGGPLSRYTGLPSKLAANDFFNAKELTLIGSFSCCMFRRNLLSDLPAVLYESRLSEFALAFYLERKGPIGFVNEPLAVYRQHAGGFWSGAGDLSKLNQRLVCRETAMRVCAPEHREIFALAISRIAADIVSISRSLQTRLATADGTVADSIRRVAGLESQLADHKRKEESLASEVANLHASQAYRVGMFVTWPARRLWSLAKRICRVRRRHVRFGAP